MTRPRHLSHLPSHRSVLVARRTCRAPRSTPTTVHPHASLVFVLEGTAEAWCGTTYSVKPGDVLLIPEGMPHYLTSRDAAETLVLSLCTSCMTSAPDHGLVAVFHEVAAGAGALRTVAVESRRQLGSLLTSLEGELGSASPWRDLAVEGYLALISTIVLRAGGAETLASGPTLSARALSFITPHATSGISLAEVAAHVHRSTAHTAAVVKSETGRTVVQWITHARLAVACQLLLHSDETVEAIGARVGFASPSHFHRVFKRLHRLTPSAWRKVHRTAVGRGGAPPIRAEVES